MLPWSQLPTYVFVAFFVLIVVFVAVPAREEVVKAGKRNHWTVSMWLPIVTELDWQGEVNALCS